MLEAEFGDETIGSELYDAVLELKVQVLEYLSVSTRWTVRRVTGQWVQQYDVIEQWLVQWTPVDRFVPARIR